MTTDLSAANRDIQAAFFGEVKKNWGWLLALGILFVILGTVGLGMSAFLTLTSVMFFGILLIVGGVAELFQAFTAKGWKSVLWSVVIAVLYVAGGIMVMQNPLLASSIITLMLAGMFIAIGILRIFIAFQIRATGQWLWTAIAGVASILLGVMIYAKWPASGLVIIGLFIAIEMLIHGWSLVSIALVARQAPEIPSDQTAA